MAFGAGQQEGMRSDMMVPGEVEGTDYLLSSTMRIDESFFQILGEFKITSLSYDSHINTIFGNPVVYVPKLLMH